jgi:hypothetical protein
MTERGLQFTINTMSNWSTFKPTMTPTANETSNRAEAEAKKTTQEVAVSILGLVNSKNISYAGLRPRS